jgi:YHS domain-containing protein
VKRLLFFLAIFAGAILLLRRFSGLFAPPAAPAVDETTSRAAKNAAGKGPRRARELVRDKVCNTFLSRDSAISARVGQETLYFCSEECRRRHLASGEDPGGDAGGARLMSNRT